MIKKTINPFFFTTSKFKTYRDVILNNDQIQKRYSRSSGPGGQSVNKTNSKAQVRIMLKECSVVDSIIQNNLKQKYRNYINKAGQLIVTSQIHKSQSQNLNQCIQKVQKMIFNCSQVPQERKYEIFFQTKHMQDQRIEQKRRKSVVKGKRNLSKKFQIY